jgi:hypothetical protein
MTTRLHGIRAAFALGLAACGARDAVPPAARTIDEAALAALPELTIEAGPLVCTAYGQDGCPLRAPVANRLADGRIALWEPGFTIHRFAPGDTIGAPLGRAGPGGSYLNAIAIASTGSDRYRVVTLDGAWRVLTFDDAGVVQGTDSIADPGTMTVIGFVGSQPVMQRMRGWAGDTAGHLQVSLLDRLTDTTGTVILDTPVSWLHGGTATAGPIPPLVATNPVWALTSDGDLVWSPGDRLVVERRTRGGEVAWRLDGPANRPTSPADLDAREAALRADFGRFPLSDEDLASMRNRSDSLLPAVVGLITAPDGRVIVSRGLAADRTAIEYMRLAADGTPESRFRLDPRIRILLTEGDSLMVHTPTEGEPWEVRWMRLK